MVFNFFFMNAFIKFQYKRLDIVKAVNSYRFRSQVYNFKYFSMKFRVHAQFTVVNDR